MAFRRQDIPKTTRKGEEGQPRRLYPRFAKDRTLVPKVELAIGYLDGMVGRRRGDLSPDAVLELFGDPKLARCILACLADSYRYRTPEIAEVIGDDAAGALAAWDLLTPADVRGHIYLAANAGHGGFVAGTERAAFLTDVAGPLGLEAAQLEELLHLDAERNALLIRVGPRPRAVDVLARYNAMLALSVLRHASEVTLELPGLDPATIETICTRHDVAWRRLGSETIRLTGRRNALGSWSHFGARVARCALQLMLLAPRAPSGSATVHLNDQTLAYVLDGFVVGALRPKQRAVAGADGVVRCTVLMEEVQALRRKTNGGGNGWTMRRAQEPVVVDDALLLPELIFTRDQTAVAVVPVAGADRAGALAALTLAQAARPVIALGDAAGAAVPALPRVDAAALVALLDDVAGGLAGSPTPLGLVADEVLAIGWVGAGRLTEVLGERGDLARQVQALTVEGESAYVPGFGLCRVALLDDLLDRLNGGPLDVAGLRLEVAARVGEGPGADALTLHLLSRHGVVSEARPGEYAETSRAA